MKCPKCGYLGFESVERCRNCGYEFSLTTAAHQDLPMRQGSEAIGPLDELPLADPRAGHAGDRLAPSGGPSRSRERQPASELPLFGDDIDDIPLITRAAAPRQPLAVRRATPEIPRLRTETRPPEPSLPDLVVEPPVRSARSIPIAAPPRYAAAAARDDDEGVADSAPAAASVMRRVGAAIIDAILVAVIDVPVIYLTLEITGLTLAESGQLPKVPLIAFLVLLAMGYHVAFTTGGQTPGQMLFGIRVVTDRTASAPGLTRAFVRTIAWMVLLLPAGLGLASVLLDEQHRGLHDRFASTRVVDAGV